MKSASSFSPSGHNQHFTICSGTQNRGWERVDPSQGDHYVTHTNCHFRESLTRLLADPAQIIIDCLMNADAESP